MRIAIALLLGTAAATSVSAQESPLIYNAKPEVSRTTCDPQAVYDLVAIDAASTYRATKADAPGGFDPAGQTATCGSVTRAAPLTCVTSTGVRATDQAACEPNARTAYERKNLVSVHRAPGTGFDYYVADTRTVGSAPMATAVKITTDIVDSCLQITELEAYSNGVNVALASQGSTITATPAYNGDTPASRATDGSRSGMYHSTCSGGNYLQVNFAKPVRLDSLAIYGRTDEWGRRDLYGYQVLNGSTVVASGQMDGRNRTGTATLGGSCQAQTFEWRSVAGTCEAGRATATITCNDAATGQQVDESRCSPSMRPPSVTTCNTQTSVTSIPEVQVGWCGYTSSGGGRYACGPMPDGFAKVGQVASWPYPSELCTGKLITNGAGQPSTKNWGTPPVTPYVEGAKCVIQMKSGYSGHKSGDRPTWEPYYYDGPPTGRPGGTYIRSRP
jgi:hypothetical protein